MSKISLFKSTRPPSEMAEADVDITPIMNMFVILIPFLVSMAVFTQVSIIEFSVPSDVGQSRTPSSDKPRMKLTVLLTETFLGVVEGENMLDSLSTLDNGQYPFDSLRAVLSERRPLSDFPDEVVVSVRDRIAFRYVVRAMDVSRESGFTKIGISGAAE